MLNYIGLVMNGFDEQINEFLKVFCDPLPLVIPLAPLVGYSEDEFNELLSLHGRL